LLILHLAAELLLLVLEAYVSGLRHLLGAPTSIPATS
jgi:hypothetical protein